MNPRIPHYKKVMVACTSIISIHYSSFLLCSHHYTTVWIKNCSKSTSVIKVATMKNMMVPRAPVIIWNWSIHCLLCQLCLTRYTAVRIKNCLKSTSVINERYGWFFVKQRKPTTKLAVSKDEWNTKDTGKSLKNALHVLRCAKRHLSGWSDVKQWRNQACSLSCYQVRLVRRHQAVS